MNQKWSKLRITGFILLAIATAVVIVYFMPHTQMFSYDYPVGKPWKYSKISADYNFPIYKTDEQMQAERDSVLRSIKPFFNYNDQVARQQAQALRHDLATNSEVHASYAEKLKVAELLAEVYGRGVASQKDYDRVADSVESLSLVNGTTVRVAQAADVFSPRTAYEFMTLKADSMGLPKDIIAQCNVNNYIVPNIVYDEKRSMLVREEKLSSIIDNTGTVQKGEKIIDRGEIVTEKIQRELDSLKREIENRKSSWEDTLSRIVGQFICVLLLLGVYVAYLLLYRRDYFDKMRNMLFMLVMVLIFTVAASFAQQDNELNIYIVPFAIVPIFTRVFFDSRTAFSLILIIVAICSLTLHNPYEFMLLQIVTAITSIYSLRELTSRSQLMRTMLLVVVSTALVKFGYDLSQGLFASLDTSWYIRIAINGVLLLFAYPAMLLFEKLFGFVSSVTLVELSNVNTPLLRRLSKEAQGTFIHSMQVANLCAEVATKLNADVQLVRTAALYHDIGKLANPAFFTENQFGNNPHDRLQEKQSAQIIIHHISDGVELADKHRLPAAIKECIATHHGRSKAKYFYVNFVNKHPGEPVNEELFTYPGPNPRTKEQAILMMADSVEAASRSLKEMTDENLRKLIDNIIDQQVADGYFKECPITYREIAMAKDSLVASLKTVYHTRISYPEMARPAEETPAQPAAGAEASAASAANPAPSADNNATRP